MVKDIIVKRQFNTPPPDCCDVRRGRFLQGLFLAGIEIVRYLETEHDAPTEGTGIGDTGQADAGGQQSSSEGAQAGLQAGADEGSGHLAHAAVEALEAVGQRRQGVEQRHIA